MGKAVKGETHKHTSGHYYRRPRKLRGSDIFEKAVGELSNLSEANTWSDHDALARLILFQSGR